MRPFASRHRFRGLDVRARLFRFMAAGCAMLLTNTSAWSQCNCTCDTLVPSSQQINASMMNESGGSPTHLVSAGAPSGAAREVRHGNLFAGNGMTITHVCIALQSPSGQPGEIANIQFYQPDPDPINMNLPGVMYYNQQFQVSPGFNNHQIVQLVTPQTANANFWLVVAYPTAQPAIGHQGTRPRTQGNSAVYIAGPPEPGWQPKWEYYDDMGGPGGTAGYLGNAPIIRPLNIGPSGSVCPYDASCCNTVCTIDQSCCVMWHPLCEELAYQNCFSGGCTNCPSQGVPENEACNTDVNGGCDTNGVFTQITCDTTICGSVWRPPVGPQDTDWYRIDVFDTDGSGQSFFTFTVDSEAAIEVLLHNDHCPNDPLHVIYTGQNVPVCIQRVFGGAVPSPGSYRISVRAIGQAGTCAAVRPYTILVDVDDCGGPPPPNDVCDHTTNILLTPGTFTYDTTNATTDGPARACGFNGVNDADVWFNYIAPCNGTVTLTTTSSFDRLLAAYTDCPQAGGTLFACGAGLGPAPATISFQTVAGQVYVIRHGGINGAQGVTTMQIDFQTCAADLNGDCTVNVADLLTVISNWGPCPPPCPPYCAGDANQSCVVNVADLLAVISGWGPCP